jgi:hypothetical protein
MVMRMIVCVAALAMFGASAFAAGIDSRSHSCVGLHAVIATRGFVYIDIPRFKDFVVAGPQYCSGGDRLEPRSVATSDNAQCVVRYCAAAPDFEAE